MRSNGVLHRVWTRRLSALRKHWRAATEGDVRAVHQARVASRRLRESLPIVGLTLPPDELLAVRKAVRRVTRALGPVREADVSMRLLDDIGRAQAPLLPAVAATRRRVEEARAMRGRLMLDELGHSAGVKIIKRLDGVRQYPDPPAAQWRLVLAERTRLRGIDLRDAVDEAGILYEPERLHQIRIAAKKLRYSLELAGETRAASARRFVNELKGLQDHLGHLHDLQVVSAYAAGVPPDESLASGVDRLARHLDDTCHDLHAKFLAGRMRLLGLTDVVLEKIVPRIASQGGGEASRVTTLIA